MSLARGEPAFVPSGDLALHVRWDGAALDGSEDGGPPLVYLNSLGSDLRIWDGVVARLPGRPHLRHDLRGHGLSDAPAGPYTIAAMADDLLGLLDAVGVARAVLVGVSVGGQVALRAALARPDRVAALVLCDTAARLGTEQGWNDRIEAVRAEGLPSLAPRLLPRWFGPAFLRERPDDARGYGHMLARTPQEGYLATCAALRDEDLRPHLDRIRAPALVLGGEHDLSTPLAVVRELAKGLPAGRWGRIDEAGHLPCVERPRDVAAQIHDFLQEVTVAR